MRNYFFSSYTLRNIVGAEEKWWAEWATHSFGLYLHDHPLSPYLCISIWWVALAIGRYRSNREKKYAAQNTRLPQQALATTAIHCSNLTHCFWTTTVFRNVIPQRKLISRAEIIWRFVFPTSHQSACDLSMAYYWVGSEATASSSQVRIITEVHHKNTKLLNVWKLQNSCLAKYDHSESIRWHLLLLPVSESSDGGGG